MALIETVAPEAAEGDVKEIYDTILSRLSFIPKPTVLLSASPALLDTWWTMTGHYLQHERFTPPLTAAIRLLVAFHGEFPYCIELNTRALKMYLELDDDQIAGILQDPTTIPLPDDDKALLLFVLDAVREPTAVTAEQIQALRDRGWADQHIFEAVYYGGWMQHLGLLFNVFRMHEG